MMFRNSYRRHAWDWDPWQDLRRLRSQVNSLMEDIAGTTEREFPAVNIWAGDNDVVLTAELPGIDPKDLDITVEGNTLTIRGARALQELKESETYHRQERSSGKFVRSLQLPYNVNQSQVQARIEKGILELTLPRAEADKPRKITVKTT